VVSPIKSLFMNNKTTRRSQITAWIVARPPPNIISPNRNRIAQQPVSYIFVWSLVSQYLTSMVKVCIIFHKNVR